MQAAHKWLMGQSDDLKQFPFNTSPCHSTPKPTKRAPPNSPLLGLLGKGEERESRYLNLRESMRESLKGWGVGGEGWGMGGGHDMQPPRENRMKLRLSTKDPAQLVLCHLEARSSFLNEAV